jgi:hypothetical protein
MTDDYPPDWIGDEPPDRRDWLEQWEPTPSQEARAAELHLHYAARTDEFPALLRAYCDDVLAEKSLPAVLLAHLQHSTFTMIGSQGEQLTLRRLVADVEVAREDALREVL